MVSGRERFASAGVGRVGSLNVDCPSSISGIARLRRRDGSPSSGLSGGLFIFLALLNASAKDPGTPACKCASPMFPIFTVLFNVFPPSVPVERYVACIPSNPELSLASLPTCDGIEPFDGALPVNV